MIVGVGAPAINARRSDPVAKRVFNGRKVYDAAHPDLGRTGGREGWPAGRAEDSRRQEPSRGAEPEPRETMSIDVKKCAHPRNP